MKKNLRVMLHLLIFCATLGIAALQAQTTTSTSPGAASAGAATAPVSPTSTTGDSPKGGVAARGDTVLHRNDYVRVVVFQEDDLAVETRISKSGSINFPLIGSVKFEGRTVDEITSEIRTRLDKDYIVNPHVTLMIVEFAKQWVTVLGEVQRPGQVEIPAEGGLDLLGALALAGGYTRIADPSHVTLRRTVNGKDVIYKLNAKQLSRDITVKPFPVLSGDTINVGQSLF